MNYENTNNNQVFLTGKIISEPVFSHETFGEGFYECNLEVDRLSGAKDVLPIIVSEKLISGSDFKSGSIIALKGQMRSFNKQENDKSKLVLSVFVRELCDVLPDQNSNIIEISGFICKPPIYRTTPFKREICDVLIAVNRAYNKSDYLPCIAWGRNARYLRSANVGDKLSIVGRIQSRQYQKKLDDGSVITKIAYEISVGRVSVAQLCSEEEQVQTDIPVVG